MPAAFIVLSTASKPSLSMFFKPLALTRSRTKRPISGDHSRLDCILGSNTRLDLLLACETLFPLMGRFPVTGQTLDMTKLQWGYARTARGWSLPISIHNPRIRSKPGARIEPGPRHEGAKTWRRNMLLRARNAAPESP